MGESSDAPPATVGAYGAMSARSIRLSSARSRAGIPARNSSSARVGSLDGFLQHLRPFAVASSE